MKRIPVKKLSQMALLTAVALALHVIEAAIPSPVPIPGVKLGLANIITVCAVFSFGPGAAAMILIARILLGSLFAGQIMSLLYSLAGGLLCLLVMILLRRIVSPRQVWVCSVVGAVAHNLGQILVAMLVTGTPSIIVYLPVLLLSGIAAGLFTGLAAQAVLNHMEKLHHK